MNCFRILILFILFAPHFLPAQDLVESLKKQLAKPIHDTAKLTTLVELCGNCDPEEIPNYAQQIFETCDKLTTAGDLTGLEKKLAGARGTAYDGLGYYYYFIKNDLKNALPNFLECRNWYEKAGFAQGVVSALQNIGTVYNQMGNLSDALQSFSEALKRSQKHNYPSGIGIALYNMAEVYSSLGERQKAIEYGLQSIKILEKTDEKVHIATALNNLGNCYIRLNDEKKALDYLTRALDILIAIDVKPDIAGALSNIGTVYDRLNDRNKALEYYKNALSRYREINNKIGVCHVLNNIGSNYSKDGRSKLGLIYADSALVIAKQLGMPEYLVNCEALQARVYNELGRYKEAFEHYKQYILYKDSINNESTRKASIKSQLKYEFEKKELVIKEQHEKEKAVAREKSRFQMIVIVSVLIGLLLVIVFAVFIFRSLKLAKVQKAIIEEKQMEILDSIQYAKRIQQALITNEKYIERNLQRLNKDRM